MYQGKRNGSGQGQAKDFSPKLNEFSQQDWDQRIAFAICEADESQGADVVRGPSGAYLIFHRLEDASVHLRRSGVEGRYRILPILISSPAVACPVDNLAGRGSRRTAGESAFYWRTRAGLFSLDSQAQLSGSPRTES